MTEQVVTEQHETTAMEFLTKAHYNEVEPTFTKSAAEDIAEKARLIIVKELRKLGAPQNVIDLFDQFSTLEDHLNNYRDQIPGWMDQDVINNMGEISHLIEEMGYSIFEDYS